MLKKLVSLLLIVVLLSISNFSFAFADDTPKDKITNFDSYMTWVKENVNKDEASKLIGQIKALPLEKQKKFISYLNDADLMTKALREELNHGETKYLENGDISITLNETNQSINFNPMIKSSSAIQYRRATYTKDIEIFGIAILENVVWVDYSHDGNSILGIQGCDAVTTRNFIPVWSLSWSGLHSWGVGGTRAYASADITFSVLYQGSITLGAGEIGVWGDINNLSGGWIKKL
jgi:hypothetical protein